MKKLIILSGKAQSGKDTVACALMSDLMTRGQRVLRISYADLLKYTLKQYYDWDGKKDSRGRRLLQHVGTDEWRSLDPDVWVDYVMSVVHFMQHRYDYIVIPDARFQNERDIPVSLYGDKVLCFRIIKEGHREIAEANHVSEDNDALDGFEDVVNKEGSTDHACDHIMSVIFSDV